MLFYLIFSRHFKHYASEMLKLYLKVPRNGRASFFPLIVPNTKDIHQWEGNKKSSIHQHTEVLKFGQIVTTYIHQLNASMVS